MNNAEILEKAIQKAIDGGWDGFYTPQLAQTFISSEGGLVHVGYDLIFDHDFAKALWSDKNTDYILYCQFTAIEPHLVAWQYQLQQMVIADNPIKYLGENI